MSGLRKSEVFARPAFLLLALTLLHAGLLQDPMTLAGKGFLLGHLGVILLWQPLVSGERRFSGLELAIGAVIIIALGVWITWGVVLAWMLVLTGAIGAKLFLYPDWRARLPLWLALLYLTITCVGLVVPEIIRNVVTVPDLLRTASAWSLFPLGALMLVFGASAENSRDAALLDLAGGFVIVFLLMGVLLGAIALMFVGGMDYLHALMQSLAIAATQLLLLAWLWGPRRGVGGVGLSLMRKVLSGNVPYEQWLSAVANLSAREESPEGLVREALSYMARWSFIRGLSWSISGRQTPEQGDGCGQIGVVTPFRTRLQYGAVTVEVFTPWALGPTPAWQLDMMVRILAEFHLARVQSQHLQALSYLRAVHETGARMTHEVKNLLQSLDTLCFALAHPETRSQAEVQAMLARQLPAMSDRLHDALDRIRQPQSGDLLVMDAERWWASLQERYHDSRIRFRIVGKLLGQAVSAALFDAVADNLLRNALEKGPDVRIVVSLTAGASGCSLDLSDDGEPIAPDRASRLFAVPLDSDTGLGIGLYQAGRLAESAGFVLSLAENRRGCVRFCLAARSV